MTSHAEYNKDTTSTDATKAFHDQIEGRTILITGVAPGAIGEQTALTVASQSPAKLIISGRSVEKLNAASENIKKQYPDANIHILIMDLSSIKSVREGAAKFNSENDHLDVLINNAGVMAIKDRTLSVDGTEMQFATNHIGHFVFTNLVLPKLIASASNPSNPKGSTRIINVSSSGHAFSPVRFHDYNWEGKQVPPEEQGSAAWMKSLPSSDDLNIDLFQGNDYNPWGAYGQSKTANILFSVYLADHLYEKYGIVSLALHPGGIQTNLGRHLLDEHVAEFMKAGFASLWKNVDQGASTTIVAAFDPKINNWEPSTGYFLSDCQFTKTWYEYAVDKENAKKLWALSEEIVGEKFEL